ncbi:hypothetical protein NM688_g1795 [Phlebia brevispora]|uniref:Uncharacterized protein n=1 Tax=Phlebia brevispora TaxID=194682 RepID=A0ACC1TAT5_9APHY|nr:hypothetical protein NM688_g1795 [Phlebia brevispora]
MRWNWRLTVLSLLLSASGVPVTPLRLLKAFIAALAAYEYLVTLEYEYEFGWRRKWTASTWLFIVNRYMLLVNVIASAVPDSAQAYVPLHVFTASQRSMISVAQMLQPFSNVFYDVPVQFPADHRVRVFALLDRAYVTAGCVLVLGLTQVVTALYQSGHLASHYVDDPVIGSACFQTATLPPSVVFYGSDMVQDIPACQTGKLRRPCYGNADDRIAGIFYFAVLAVVNMTSLLTYALNKSGPSNPVANFIAVQVSAPFSFCSILTEVTFSAPNFRVPSLPEFVGNLGEPLAYGDDNDDQNHEARDGEAEVCGPGARPGELLNQPENEDMGPARHIRYENSETEECYAIVDDHALPCQRYTQDTISVWAKLLRVKASGEATVTVVCGEPRQRPDYASASAIVRFPRSLLCQLEVTINSDKSLHTRCLAYAQDMHTGH